MVTEVEIPQFDHRDRGTPESLWAESELLRSASVFDLSGARRLIVLAAHPDDESLGAGGLLATANRLGIETTVLIATLGERSHPRSVTHTQSQLAAVRRDEVFAALRFVAPASRVRLLGLPDGDLLAYRHELVGYLRKMVLDEYTVVAAHWRADGHPDHAAIGEAAAEAVAGTAALLLEYPIWAWHWGTPDKLPVDLMRLDLDSAELGAKHAALQCHRSQIEPLSQLPGDEAILRPEFTAHFERPYEIFVSGHQVAAAVLAVEPPSPVDPESLPQEFFDDFYGDEPDPWRFESRWYETRKRAITMASLPRQSFRSAFEPGCSIGVLTAELAPRCEKLLATDISERPLVRARQRLADAPGARFERRRIPAEWPSEQFDLIVLSEVGYYCGVNDLRTLAYRAGSSLTPDGVLVACHWRHPVGEYPLRGDDVHRALIAEPGLVVVAEHIEEDFLLHVFTRPPGLSVARETGLVP